MGFRLLDHLDDLEVVTTTNSQVTARCPICNSKLQITTRNSAYFCVAGCKPVDIREKLGYPKTGEYITKPEPPIIPLTLPSHIELFRTVEKIDIPDTQYISSKHKQRVRKREFQYAPNHKIVRIDLLVDKKKIFYPLIRKNNEWVVHNPDDVNLYCPINFEPDNKFIVFVEGEQCVVDLCNAGIVSVTTSSFNWNENKLTDALLNFKRKISGIIYIPDNDLTGIRKAILVQNVCWRIGLPCKIVNLRQYYVEKNDDVSDLINRGIDVVQILEGILRNEQN